MKITSDNETLAEHKVLILYVLSNVNKSITNDALYSIVSSAVDINYFHFQQFLLDLITAKFVRCYEKEIQSVYEITELGLSTLELTLDILPGIVKLQIDNNFKDRVEEFSNMESIVAEFTPINETQYVVECKIIENGEVQFEIKTNAYSREQAQNIVQNWKNNANFLYPELLKILTETPKNYRLCFYLFKLL